MIAAQGCFQNANSGRPLVAAADGIVHGVGNGINGTYNGFTFENGICTGHPQAVRSQNF